MYQKIMDFLDGEKINKKGLAIFLVAGGATVLSELSIQVGIAPCTFPLIILAVLFVFLKYIFPTKSEE